MFLNICYAEENVLNCEKYPTTENENTPSIV